LQDKKPEASPPAFLFGGSFDGGVAPAAAQRFDQQNRRDHARRPRMSTAVLSLLSAAAARKERTSIVALFSFEVALTKPDQKILTA
jgi:hypothetical protein